MNWTSLLPMNLRFYITRQQVNDIYFFILNCRECSPYSLRKFICFTKKFKFQVNGFFFSVALLYHSFNVFLSDGIAVNGYIFLSDNENTLFAVGELCNTSCFSCRTRERCLRLTCFIFTLRNGIYLYEFIVFIFIYSVFKSLFHGIMECHRFATLDKEIAIVIGIFC